MSDSAKIVKPRPVHMRVIKEMQPVQKTETSTQIEMQEAFNGSEWIQHPMDLHVLERYVSESSILPQCIHAYRNNIPGFGIGVRYVEDTEETPEMEAEFNSAKEIIELLTIEQDTKEIFEDIIEARETYGIAYVEVIRNLANEVVQIEFIRNTPSMKKLNEENANNIVEAPYLVLLDEANLSPIEFYWSNFNYYCDDPTHQVVSYSNGEKYEFGSELKFLATINYDQTTADLSPRFLDRAWVISMNPVSVDVIVSGLMDDSVVENNSEVISLETLNNIFDWHNVKDKKMNQITKTRLDRIIDKMKEGGHTISARSIHLISHYYLVAEMFMSSKEVALDYAISQKILPCINGNGKQYKEFLNGLMTICKENQLNKSASIVSKILEKSEHEFYSFFSL